MESDELDVARAALLIFATAALVMLIPGAVWLFIALKELIDKRPKKHVDQTANPVVQGALGPQQDTAPSRASVSELTN